MRYFTAFWAFGMIAFQAQAHDFQAGDLTIAHPVALETPKTARAGAGYLEITNAGETADRLIDVEADFPRVMVHDTIVEDDVARMVHLHDGLVIEPGETVALRPGGKHVMFMGLDGDPLEEGETIAATLVFENAGRVDVVFNVETRETFRELLGDDAAMDAEMDHSAHGDNDQSTHGN